MAMTFTAAEIKQAALVLVVDEHGHYRWSSTRPDTEVESVLRRIAGDLYERRVRKPVMAATPAVDEAAECLCVMSCADDPATACSLSGEWHTHADNGSGTFGPCPVHPDAPGDR